MLQDSKDLIRNLIRQIGEAVEEIEDLEPRSESRDDILRELDDLKENTENILRMM